MGRVGPVEEAMFRIGAETMRRIIAKNLLNEGLYRQAEMALKTKIPTLENIVLEPL